jgi:Flp pilus assembly protein TadB
MKPPRIPSVFKLSEYNSHKRFGYEPRTFNERKERLENRKQEIDRELQIEKKLGKKYEAHLRDQIGESWSRRETRRQKRNSSVRLLLILAALLVLIFLIYNNFSYLI